MGHRFVKTAQNGRDAEGKQIDKTAGDTRDARKNTYFDRRGIRHKEAPEAIRPLRIFSTEDVITVLTRVISWHPDGNQRNRS